MEETYDFLLNYIVYNNNMISKVCNFFSNAAYLCQRQKEICRQRIRRNRIKKRLLVLLAKSIRIKSPRLWKLERSSLYWEYDCQQHGDEKFKDNFRMTRQTFDKLCGYLTSMKKEDTHFRNAIPFEKRVAIAVYALGSSAEYRTIGNLFGVSKSMVCKILLEFCHEAYNQLKPLHLSYFPLSRETIEECVNGFDMFGLPQCLGAIDGCHIEVHPTSEDAVDYYNYKGWYSTVLLALVDYRFRFLYINVGSPGRCNDSQIYERSLLKKSLSECHLLSEYSKVICETNVPIYIIGDSAFRFSPNLMKPYPFHAENDARRKAFNYALSKDRRVVENAFGHLKARFRRIGKGIDNKIENVNIVIQVCCVLHNFLNEHNDKINKKWLIDFEKYEKTRQYPDDVMVLDDIRVDAEKIRHAISLHVQRGVLPDGVEELIADGEMTAEELIGDGETTAELN